MSARPPRRSAAQRRAELRRRRLVALAVLIGVVVGLVAAVSAIVGGGDDAPKTAAAKKADGPPPPPVQVLWVGDTTLGSTAGDPPDEGRALFANVRSRLRKSDITFANLEGTLARDAPNGGSKCGSDEGNGSCFAFTAPQAYAGALKWAGVDIVNLANNHANDYGPAGEYSTIKALFAHGIAHTGLPKEITVLERRGTRVAFLGFAPYPWAASLNDIPGAQALVRQAAAQADVVVVAMHAGAEGRDATHTPVGVEEAYGENRGDTRGFAHGVIDAGADLVVASGPHVLRGMEAYRGKLIAYSLGNFAGWKNFAQGDVLSLSGMLRVTLSGRGAPLAARFTPLVLADPGIPEYDPSGQATTLINELSEADFGAAAAKVGPGGKVVLPAAPAAATAPSASR